MKRWSLRLASYARPQLGSLLVVGGLVLASASVEALKPWPMKLLIDHVLIDTPLPDGVRWLAWMPGGDSPTGLVAWLTGATVALFLTASAVKMVQAYVQAGASTRMMYHLGADLFAHIQQLSLRFHARSKTGDLLQRVITDARCVRELVISVILPLLTSTATLLVMFGVMWRLDSMLTLVALAVVPALLLAIRLFAKEMEERTYEHSELQGEMMGAAEQTLTAIPIVQAFGREPHEDRRFGELTERTGRAYVRTVISQLRFKTSTSTAMALGTAAITLFGGLRVLDGQLSVGSLLVFLSYLTSLYEPLETMAYLSSGYAAAAAGARRVFQVMDQKDSVEDAPDARDLPIDFAQAPPSITFDDVTFGYQAGNAVVQHVSFTVGAGETVALVGKSGSGKSTLGSLILRLFDPWSGRVLFNGQDIRAFRLASFRSHVALVLQEPFLLPLTIADNIAYGRPSASREEVMAAARAAQADAFIRQMPDGYDTVIGERGATLSGGQRQRISIARAFLKNAPVLILDEPTASLDAQTESELMVAMERLLQGRTAIIIAHRPSTVRYASRVFVLEGGRITESGRPDEPARRGGTDSHLQRVLP